MVISPQSYAEWDGILDLFDHLREDSPVAKVVAEDDSFEPFWLITRYEDVMRISKDNKTFLNNPKPVVFATRDATEFSTDKTVNTSSVMPSWAVFIWSRLRSGRSQPSASASATRLPVM